ncbi:dentin matrix acidic phosphoprotein 1-like [Saccostrea echinata]|uniref:dentin matrix acidic phosphoprotein 1-like n=1 Tax=Saccostrea echinata TaxID=191078 RepID=UPI002A805933|nr:dentin matrix acidic phosphoprotein 1-like [Saccostrea echinata]
MNKHSLIIFLTTCIVASSAWHLRVSLNDIFKGQCRTVSPRVCRKSLGNIDPDYSCGFILRSVCAGKNKIERVRVRRSSIKPNHEHSLHVTPLPKKMAFYDANSDGQITVKEFARTLGHDPRAFHVKDAFKVADLNSDGAVDAFEFENDAWIFNDDFDDDDYDLEDTDVESYKSVNFDLLDSEEDSSSSESSSESSAHSSGESASGDDSHDSNDVSSSGDDSNDDSTSGDSNGDISGDSDSTDDSNGSHSNDHSTDDSGDDSNDDSTGDDDSNSSNSNESSKDGDSKDSDSDSKEDSKDDSDEKTHDSKHKEEVLPDMGDLNLEDIVPKEIELGDGVIGEAIDNVIGDGMELEVPELEAPDSDTLKNVGIAMALTKFQPSQNQIHSKVGGQSHAVDDHANHNHKEYDFSKGQGNFFASAMNPKPTMLSNTLLGIRGSGSGSRMRSVDSSQARERFSSIAMNNRRRVPASLWPSWIVS